VAATLIFVGIGSVHDWMLGALGYGLIPVSAWLLGFAAALRYRRAWVRRFWRAWVGTALAVAITLSIMSMFHASGGVMADASLGGYWGQYLGGTPAILGAMKVLVLALLGPVLLYPRKTGPVYGRVARRLARHGTMAVAAMAGPVTRRLRQWLENSRSAAPQKPAVPASRPEGARRRWIAPLKGPAKSSQTPPDTSGEDAETGVWEANGNTPKKRGRRGWQLPSMDLLSQGEDRPVPPAVLQRIARNIEETLTDHRVEVSVDDIRTGPRVIRFGLVPGWVKKFGEPRGEKSRSGLETAGETSRVKVQSILMREKDLALALKTPYLRLEAPVPGEALVGLEMPNPYPRRVVLRAVAGSPAFQKAASRGGLIIALGENTAGEAVVADLGALPHLLIAGATGSGKSVCINSIVASLLLKHPPDRLRLLMVDPKRVELTPFNGIPHLICPVIVDTDEVLVVLRALQNEMLLRYKLMEEQAVRNIEGYNNKSREPMPFLVVVMDELADLMMTAAYEAEKGLVRLAQLGRATGIHLILATQRPSVNVVTGLLKANIPSRVAFAVASQVDSRVILDTMGAEKLLGKGDMLLLTAESPKPQRIQGTFVHDREIQKLVEFWRTQPGPPPPPIPLHDPASELEDEGGEEDDLLDRARELAQRYPNVSPSILQRRLQIGFERAVSLKRRLEEEGLARPTRQP
jgi:S-DNA-T family DNA segregation ATPase FtsK/SpoIIIE